MTPDDVRLTAQLVAAGRVHCVSDEAVLALAQRVLELESDAEEHAANVRHVEREACAKVVEECKTGAWDSDVVRKRAAAAIRARASK